jgi:hypothetical protein
LPGGSGREAEAGKGKFAHRELPKVVKIIETKETQQSGCPDCGGHLQAIHKHEQFVTDVPVVEVKTTHFVTYSGYCTTCHRRVRLQYPEQTSQATEAAGVMMGPRAKALAADLKHRLGVSYVDDLELTNNLAERMLRPAVITRKTNGCNRTQDGATAHSILASVLMTCHQHSIPILDYLVQLQQFGSIPPSLLAR